MAAVSTVLVLLALLLGDPSVASTAGGSPAKPPAVGSPVASPAGGSPTIPNPAVSTDTIRLLDDRGRTLHLEAPARRIVSLVPSLTELLFAIGAGDRVVGRTRFDENPPEAADIPSVGDGIRPAAELVAARRPDLVVVYAGPDNRRTVAELERIGLPVMAVRHDRISDLEQNLLRLGRATGCREAATSLLERIRLGLEEVAMATRGLSVRRVYYDVWGDPPVTVGQGSFLDSLVSLAGGQNVFGDLPASSPQVSLEAIAVRRPDLILWPVSAGDGARSHPRTRPGWEAIEAVRRDAVREVDADLIHRLGPRVVDAAVALARAIHPEAKVAWPAPEDLGDRAYAGARDTRSPVEGPCGPP